MGLFFLFQIFMITHSVIEVGKAVDAEVARPAELTIGQILVKSATGDVGTIGAQLAAKEWIHFRILQLLCQCLQAMMYVVILAADANVPRIRRWLSQVVVTGAFLIQFQAWRKRKKMHFSQFFFSRLRAPGFYVFFICFVGYTLVSLNYILDEAIPRLALACCAWGAFLIALADMFIQISDFRLKID